MDEDLSAAETYFKELPEPEQARLRRVCGLLVRRHQLRGLSVMLFIAVAGMLFVAEMEYHWISPVTFMVSLPIVACLCAAFHAMYVRPHTTTIWQFALEEAELGGEEVKFALYRMADEAPQIIPSLVEFTKILS